MPENNLILNEILNAREKRYELRKEISQQKKATISLSLNIAGFPKTNDDTKVFFKTLLSELTIYLKANRYFFNDKSNNITDKAGHFFIQSISETNIDLIKLKQITEEFETNHTLGRLIDVDIFDENQLAVSSHKQKKCLLCDNSAYVCMREQNHSHEEIRKYTFEKISEYNANLQNKIVVEKLTELSIKSILYEVSLSPKPGLVDFNNSGAHSDMNFFTFLNSVSAISTSWTNFALLGLNFKTEFTKALAQIRQIGLDAEQKMFNSTSNINTHKGLIFLMGLSVFSSAYTLKSNNYIFDKQIFQNVVKSVSKDLIKNELKNLDNETKTHGEKTFKKFGIKGAGARAQAENGFPVIFEIIIPYLNKINLNIKKDSKEKIEEILQNCLLKIIANIDDSNVLFRNEKEAENLKKLSHDVLNNKATYKQLCNFCVNNNISPGGAADLLAISIFIFLIQKEFNKNEL